MSSNKLVINFKTPHAAEGPLKDHLRYEAIQNGIEDEREIQNYIDDYFDELNERLSKFIKNDEYISVEFDLDNDTAKVLEN